jgi:hypothetical protein
VPRRNQQAVQNINWPVVPEEDGQMPILRLLEHLQLDADDVTRLVSAYEETLRVLRLVDRADPIAELVARKVIEIGQTGVRDPAQISILVVRDFGST